MNKQNAPLIQISWEPYLKHFENVQPGSGGVLQEDPGGDLRGSLQISLVSLPRQPTCKKAPGGTGPEGPGLQSFA